ncbi:MAG: alpha/beta hydrolase [Candidatus Heimdallarchaeota archaeon]
MSMKKDTIMKGAEPFFYKKGEIGCILGHGYTGTPKEVRELGKYLAKKNITTIGPLLPGHGTTLNDLKLTTANDWYNEYVHAVDKLKKYCKKIFVCGLSLGGLLTLKYASENTVDGVITLAAPAKFPFLESILLPIAAPFLKKFAVKKNKQELAGQEKYDILCYDKYPIAPANTLRKMIYQVRQKLPNISAPTLIIQGLDDANWLVYSSKIIYRKISSKDKELIMLENTPHCLTVCSAKDKLHDTIYHFIKTRV